MGNFLDEYTLHIGAGSESPFLRENGTYQDGTTPLFRDKDGKLWGMSGHSHMGHIGMYAGNKVSDMRHLYPITLNFCVGNAEYAFNGVRYPEGVKARGSMWPFGLYICPVTHRFFCFFHNESGWNGRGTAYDAFGLCNDRPAFDSDFRHIGLMHSDDEGKTWTFDRWVMTAEQVCFTEMYNPNGDCAVGQPRGSIALGSGDFSIFVNEMDGFLYILYNIVRVNTETRLWEACDAYVARTRIRTDGVMGDFVKYYDGSFCEAGNFGKETPIARRAWHPRAVYLEKYGRYILTSSRMNEPGPGIPVIGDIMEVREGENLWSFGAPKTFESEGQVFGNHYVALVSADACGQPHYAAGDDLIALTNHNGTDVMQFPVRIEEV